MNSFAIKKEKRASRTVLDPWGNAYKAEPTADKPNRRPTAKSKASAKSRQHSAATKREKMSGEQLLVHQEMLEKNFKIKQRFVNEAKVFCSYHTQNLYKLQEEKQFRVELIDKLATWGQPEGQ